MKVGVFTDVTKMTPAQKREWEYMQIIKKICDTKMSEEIVERLKEVGKFDVNEIGKIVEKYAKDEDEFWKIYHNLDFKWIIRQLEK